MKEAHPITAAPGPGDRQQGSATPTGSIPQIPEDTKKLSKWSRYINGTILAGVWGVFVGEKHLPARAVTPQIWHLFLLSVVAPAILSVACDGAQAITNLIAYRRKQVDIDKGLVDRVIFGKHEFLFRLSWWLFDVKLGLTLLSAAGCVLILGRIIWQWNP
jgi:hypothetical protein